MGWKGNKQKVTFNPSPWYRYIFFSSLNDDYGGPQVLSFQNSINMSSLSKITKKKDDGITSYIQQYISQLRAWASQELASEEQFIQLAKQQGVEITDYQKGNEFDYLTFIMNINKAYQDTYTLRSKLEAHSEDLHTILQAIDNFQSTKQYAPRKVKDKKTGETRDELPHEIPFINENSIKHMHKIGDLQRVREGTLAALKASNNKLNKTSFNLNHLKDQLNIILLSPPIINAVKTAIGKGIPLDNIKKQLINTAISELERQKILDPPAMINRIANIISTMTIQSVQESYSNAMTWIERSESEIIESIMSNIEESAKQLADNFASLSLGVQRIMLTIGGNKSNAGIAYGKYKKALNDYRAGLGGTPKQIAALKGEFSKKLRADLLNAQKNQKGKKLLSRKNKLINQLKQASTTSQMTAHDFIASCITNLSISSFDMAEIRGAIQSEILTQGIAYLPGKSIQLKNDIVISYFLTDAPYQQLIDTTVQSQYNQTKKLIEDFGKDFLTIYHEKGKNTTNIKLAEQVYKLQLKKLAEAKIKLLNTVTEQTDKDKIENLFKFLSTSISVKKYEDVTYINEGFYEGSLGGGGRVVEAIPNIVAMLDAGGISLVDANTIIGALLNSFNGSALGTGYEQPLKDYLIAGAAMVLFDDGFANGQKFLDTMMQNLRAVAPGALHLLLVNDLYIPQSFILTEICNNLEQLASAISNEQARISANRASLQLHNPISYNTLRAANEQFPGEENEERRWNWVGDQARDSVTISFTFMAGMLDIIDALKAKLDQVDNVL